MNLIAKLVLASLTIFLSSCATWDADFFVGDNENNQIINKNGQAIKCTQPEFNNYGCLHQDKITELINYLKTHCAYGEK